MSKIPSFLILADRGRLRCYRVENTGRSSTPRLVESIDMVEGRQQMREIYSDKMGSFPNAGTFGQGNSPTERLTLVDELSLRTVRNLAGRMSEILDKHQPEEWGLSASSQINGTILDEMPRRWRDRLAQNLYLDLTRVPASELLEHFED